MFNKPLSDFLEYWTDVAQITRHTFDGPYPATGGLTNLPSGGDRVITYYLVNPQNYDLEIEVTFDPSPLGWDPIRTDNYPGFSGPSNHGTVEQDATDKSIIRLTLNKNALASLDGTGTEISPTVSIMEPNSGRDFGSYRVPLRVNSAPAKAKNAVIMTWNDNGTAKYAVLFYLPADINNLYSPDRDVVSMTVSGFSGLYNETFEIPASGDIGGVENTYAQGDFSPVYSGDSFIPLSGYRFVGVKTNFIAGTVDPSCTVTLRDSSGLESTTDVSTTSTKLTEIHVDPDNGKDSYPGSDILPVETIGRAMEKLSGMTGTTIILEGDIEVQNTLAFTASHPDITLKGGGTSFTLTYSGTGRAITVSGGKLTLGENITVKGASDGAVAITGGEFVMETGSALEGNGSSAISGGGVYVDGGKFTMSGGTIGGNEANSGGAVYMDGGSFTISGGTIQGQSNKKEIYSATTFAITGNPTITNCTIILEQGAHINVKGLNTAATLLNVQLNLLNGYYQENAVLLENAGSKDICGKFALDNPPAGVWWIGLDDKKQNGILRYINGNLSGNTVTVTTPPADKAGLQDLVNDSADGGYKVEITGGGNIDIDSTVSVPGGADVAIKPGGGSSVDINADGDTTAFNVSGGNLTLGGGDGTVTVDGGEETDRNGSKSLITVGTGGTLNITTGATIQNNKMIDNSGGAITVSGGGTVNMDDGKITNCQSSWYGGGIYVANGTFNMSGGIIENCSCNGSSVYGGGGVTVGSSGIFNMSKGAIIQDNIGRIGGGVYVNGGTFNMNGGFIRNNSAEGSSAAMGGGGIYMTQNGVFLLKNGEVSGNKTTRGDTHGGGIRVISGTFRYITCTFSGNTASGKGPDVFISTGTLYATTENGDTQALTANIETVDALATPSY